MTRHLLNQEILHYFVLHVLSQGLIYRTIGKKIQISKFCRWAYSLDAEGVTRWKFTRGLVFDGNFSAEQLKMKWPEDDVALSNGCGFMVDPGPYKEHLKVAVELKEVRRDFTNVRHVEQTDSCRNRHVMNIMQ